MYIGPGSEQREVNFSECPHCGGRICWCLMRMYDSPVRPDVYPLPHAQPMQNDKSDVWTSPTQGKQNPA
jgi:hypothetical protein